MARPHRCNALSDALVADLAQALDATERRADMRAVILTGAGSTFCGGLDLAEVAQVDDPGPTARRLASLLARWESTRLITITAAQGAACAGGAALATASDFLIAAEGFRIGFPEVRRGLLPVLVLTILKRQVRDRDLRELLLLGQPVDAERARAMGLINRVVPPERLLDEALRIAAMVCRAETAAVSAAKSRINALRPRSLAEELDTILDDHIAMWSTPPAREGIRAFLEKRPAAWDLGPDE